jgi:hypothetical protein
MYFSSTSTFNNDCSRKWQHVFALFHSLTAREKERGTLAGLTSFESTSALLRKCLVEGIAKVPQRNLLHSSQTRPTKATISPQSARRNAKRVTVYFELKVPFGTSPYLERPRSNISKPVAISRIGQINRGVLAVSKLLCGSSDTSIETLVSTFALRPDRHGADLSPSRFGRRI